MPDEDQETVDNFIQSHPDIRFLRLQWVDYSGILRARVITLETLKRLMASGKPFQSSSISFLCLADNTRVPFNPLAIHLLYPDWNSLRVIQSSNPTRNATVMCSIVEQFSELPDDHGFCPRLALQNIIHKAQRNHNVSFLIGFEIEFTILKHSPEGKLTPVCSQPGSYSAAGLRDPSYPLVEACILELLDAGVQIEGFHVEGNRGQYEIALSPRAPLEAVDDLVTAHDIIKSFFAARGYVATMSPKPIADRQANGAHVHVSMDPPRCESAFLAGILRRLPALWAFSMPYKASYRRRVEWEAGERVQWGTKTRKAVVRKLRDGYWEVRCVDATANMYLVVAGILAAGLLGVENGESLRWPDISRKVDGGLDSGEELPRSIGEALDRLLDHLGEFRGMLESGIVGHYINVKRQEANNLDKLDDEALSQLMTEWF